MKKLLLLGTLCFIATFTFAQMKIISNGDVGFKNATNPQSDIHIQDAGNVAGIMMERTDAANFLNLLSGTTGNAFVYKGNKRFTIGSVNSLTNTTPNAANAMYLYGYNYPNASLRGNIGVGTNAPASKLHVNGDIQYTGALISSDSRLKSDVEDFSYGLKELMRVNPVYFTYNGKGSTIDGDRHIGVIAQELQAIVPDFVESYTHVYMEEDEELKITETGQEDFLRIRDTEIKYLIINAVQEQQVMLQEKDQQIADLREELDELKSIVAELAEGKKVNTESLDQVYLRQNEPNPSTRITTIEYSVPREFDQASIELFNLNGQLLRSIDINEGGAGVVDLDVANLKDGIYVYALKINEQLVENNKLVVQR